MAGKWRTIVEEIDTECSFPPPATAEAIAATEAALGLKLPPDLRELLLECNGIVGEYGLGVIWPIERIEADNTAFRTDVTLRDCYMPFDHLLFFGDAGNGDRFAFAVRADGNVHPADVYIWNHEDDSRTYIAPSLAGYLEGCLSHRIAI